MGEINKTDELKHWGVLGMKWGVRRSKKQLDKSNNKKKAKIEKDEETFKTSKKKSLSKLTDDEIAKETNRHKLENALQREKVEALRNEVTRMQLEQQYATLNPPKQSFLTKMFNDVWPRAKNATLNAGEKLLEDALVDKGKDLLGLKGEDLDSQIKRETLRGKRLANDRLEQQNNNNSNNNNSNNNDNKPNDNDVTNTFDGKPKETHYEYNYVTNDYIGKQMVSSKKEIEKFKKEESRNSKKKKAKQ